MFALVFLGFDVRLRDERASIAEALDARPVGNGTLLGGRLVGLVVVAWLPMVLVMVLVNGFGLLARAVGLTYGETLEPISTVGFLLLDALPMLALWCALVFALAIAIRNRVIVAAVALVVLGTYGWSVMRCPIHLLQAFGGFTAHTVIASDLAPTFATGRGLVQRGAELLLAAGLFQVAATFHPRPDRGSFHGKLAAGGMAILGGSVGLAGLSWDASRDQWQREEWRIRHDALEGGAQLDLQRIEARVAISPGEALDVDAEYTVRVCVERLARVVMSLNPGMRVGSLFVDGRRAHFEHEAGLLSVELPALAEPGQEVVVRVAATGVPDMDFGYLDSAIDVPRLAREAGNLLMLGTNSGVFGDSYVALMPDLRWLPMPGPVTVPEDIGTDFRDRTRRERANGLAGGWTGSAPRRCGPL